MRKARDVVMTGPWDETSSSDTMTWLARLLCDEGQDLMDVTEEELNRGTPVYVQADADALEVQRRMARHHIRVLPVLSGRALIGVVDLVELAQRDDLDTGRGLIT